LSLKTSASRLKTETYGKYTNRSRKKMEVDTPVVYDYIDSEGKLKSACRVLSKEKRIAVDLEADSLYHFQEKVCLIQMAANGSNFVVDPLAVPDLSPLAPLFADRDVQKIFHGADYDIRSLYRDFGIEINNLFDTELASRFLGVASTGLDAVVREHLGITLDKKYQKKDWSERPLPSEMIDYAASDVMYLLPISANLIEALTRKERIDWVSEECEILSGVRPPDNDCQPLFLKIKGAGRLSPRALAALESILDFRQEVARKKDRPLFKVFSNRSALALATGAPMTLDALKETGALSQHQSNMYGNRIVACIREAKKLPGNALPSYPKSRKPKPSPDVSSKIKALQEWRNAKAEALGMDAGLICNRNLATRLAVLNPASVAKMDDIEEMKGWQKAAFGEEILAVLQA
jgi:ribonuclease D